MPDPKKTLTDSDIVTQRVVGRRSFIAQAGALLLGTAAAVISGRGVAGAEDSDTTQNADLKAVDSDTRNVRADSDRSRLRDAKGRRTTDSDRTENADSKAVDSDKRNVKADSDRSRLRDAK